MLIKNVRDRSNGKKVAINAKQYTPPGTVFNLIDIIAATTQIPIHPNAKSMDKSALLSDNFWANIKTPKAEIRVAKDAGLKRPRSAGINDAMIPTGALPTVTKIKTPVDQSKILLNMQ